MIITGSLLIECLDCRNNNLVWRHQQTNLIPENTLLELLNWETRPIFGSCRISISTINTPPVPTNYTLNEIIGTGYVPTGITSPTYFDSVTPTFGEIRNRIDSVGYARTFDTVGLTGLLPGNEQADLSTTTYAYLLLSLTCTQNPFDFLDLYYRITFSNSSGQGWLDSPRAIKDFGRGTFALGRFGFDILSPNYASVPTGYKNLYNSETSKIAFSFNSGLSQIGWTSGTKINTHYKWKQTLSQNYSFGVGRIFNTMLHGISNEQECAYGYAQFPGKTTPIQNFFCQVASSNTPFFDANNFGDSKGKLELSGTWTGKLPELYRLVMGTGGATGTATYKFSVRKFLQFDGNSYTDQIVTCPFRNPNLPAKTGMHGWRRENNDILRFSDTQIIQYDDTGVTLLDIVDGTNQTWDATSTPQLVVNASRQCATDGVKIYVGDRSSGLYEINPATNTVTQLVNLSCYGVDVGRNGVVWALFEGGLRKSTNWSINVSFIYLGISNSNWNTVHFLKADPENAQDRLALVRNTGSGFEVVWRDNTSAVQGYSGSEIKPWCASLDVSDTVGFWAVQGGRLDYGTTTISAITQVPQLNLNHSIWGTGNYYKIAFYKQFLITATALIDSSNTIENGYQGLNETATCLHLVGGISIFSDYLRCLFTDNVYIWDNYGWDGSNWVKGNTAFKTTHTTNQTLINGLSVKWTNAASPPHFVTGNLFVGGVCTGLLKDSATTLFYENAWYTKALQVNVNFPSAVIPGSKTLPFVTAQSDPLLLQLESDSPKLYALKISGIATLAYYFNGELPAPGEISINPNTAVATFNTSDIGKTVTGTYAYIRN